MQDPKIQFQLSQSATTNSPSINSTAPIGMQKKIESTAEKVDRLYLRPLRKLSEHDDGYIVLIIVLVLLEKALRVKYSMGERDDFPQSHPGYDDMGTLLGVDRKLAFDFWQTFRNGLLHRALPKHTRGLGYKLNQSGIPLVQVGSILEVDAIAVKDVVMRHIDEESLWDKDGFALLPDTFERIPGELVVKLESSPDNPA